MDDITLQPVSVRNDGGSHEGRLVLANGDLIAVFVRVTAEEATGGGSQAGGWFLEAGFGPCGTLMISGHPIFATLDDAVEWVRQRLQAGIDSTARNRSS